MNIEEWNSEIKASKKRDKDFLKKGKEIEQIYWGEKDTPFNILYSNTEVLLPALYSSLPRPAISARHENDPVADAAAKACNKMIEYLLDTDIDDHDTFDGSMTSATLDSLLPGRAVSTIEYDSDDEVNYEVAVLTSKKWNRVLFGYAEKWSDMPWVAYEMYLTEEEAKEKFGELPKDIEFSTGNDEKEDGEKDQGVKKTALFYQIWEKETKSVKYLSPEYKDNFVHEIDDPLGITGFFNCPKPLQFVRKSHSLIPTALYTIYEKQAEEVNKLTQRLNRIIAMIKAVFLFDGSLGMDIESLVEESDGGMIPTDKGASLLDGGLSKSIWSLPIAELMAVAQQLYTARETSKQIIYEITGISDILRGQSRASETLGAQKIKESWGTMRVKSLQKEVQRYASDCMKMILEVAISKFSVKSWAKMTGLAYSTEKQRETAQLFLQNQPAPAQIDPGAPPPQPDPRVMEAQKLLQAPQWEIVLKSLKNDVSRSYKIDIETNSTLDVEATEDKAMIGDFMNAFSQFMNGISPMIQDGSMPFGAAKAMLLTIIKRYRFGREVEEEIKAMQPPQTDPKVQKARQELQAEKEKLNQEKEQIGKEKQALAENAQKKADSIIQQEDALKERARQESEKLEREQRKLEEDRMQFEFDRRMSKLEIENDRLKAGLDHGIANAEANIGLREQINAHQRDIQSLLDKHASHVEKMMRTENADIQTPVPEGA